MLLVQDYDYYPLSFCLPADRDKLLEFDSNYRASLRVFVRKSNRKADLKCVNGGDGHPAANPGNLPLLAPPTHGCWPAPGAQPQPQPQFGDRIVYIVKPDGGSRGQGIYLALGLDGIEELHDGDDGDSDDTDSDGDNANGRSKNKFAGGAGPRRPATADEEDEEEQQKFVMVQAYLPRPLLMDGRKFDLRIYVLVTSTHPTLRLFIYRQGLVRFATEQYAAPDESNVSKRRMFLTNYAVNKPGERPRSPKTGIDDVPEHQRPVRYDPNPGGGADIDNGDDDEDDDAPLPVGGARKPAIPPRSESVDIVRARVGCKWTISTLFECLEGQGVDTAALWERVKDVITKTILAVRPAMAQKYKAARPSLRKEAPPVLETKPKKRIPRPTFSKAPSLATDARAVAHQQATGDPPSAGPASTDPSISSASSASDPTPSSVSSSSSLVSAFTPVLPSVNSGTSGAMNSTAANSNAPGVYALAPGGRPSNPQPGLKGSRPNPGLVGMGLDKSKDDALGVGIGGGLGLVGTSMPLISSKPPLVSTRRGGKAGQTTGKMGGGPGSSSAPMDFGLSVGGSSMSIGGQSHSSVQAPVSLYGKSLRNITAASGPGSESQYTSLQQQQRQRSSSAGRVLDASGVVATLTGTTVPLSEFPSVVSASSASSAESSVAVPASSSSAPPSAQSTPKRSVTTSSIGSTPRQPSQQQQQPASISNRSSIPGMKMGPNNSNSKDDQSWVEEDDGEQGFKSYELMGLDVILDMSHCICARTVEHQRLHTEPGKWKALNSDGKKRCQPRPVLLEINQSCSLHSDSDLDKIVKGDAVTDGFVLSAPDDKWLLEQFAETIKMGGGLAAVAEAVAKGSSGSGDVVSVAGSDNSSSETAASAAASSTASIPAAVPGPVTAPELLAAIEAAEAALAAPSLDPKVTKQTLTGTIMDDRYSVNDIANASRTAVALARAAVEESSMLLHLYRNGFPIPSKLDPATAASGSKRVASKADLPTPTGAPSSAGADASSLSPTTGIESVDAVAADDDGDHDSEQLSASPSPPDPPPDSGGGSGSTAIVAVADSRASPAFSSAAAAAASAAPPAPADLVPWIPPPAGNLYTAFPRAWEEELWFGQRWDLGLGSNSNGGAGGSSIGKASGESKSARSAVGSVVSTVMALKRAASMSKAEALQRESDNNSSINAPSAASSDSGSAASTPTASLSQQQRQRPTNVPPAWSLGTVPQLSQRAQLVLLLRRLYEEIHMGGFERMIPPPNKELAERYRRIAEYVPPSMRETFAFAKRRMEALAQRAAMEAKKNSGFRL